MLEWHDPRLVVLASQTSKSATTWSSCKYRTSHPPRAHDEVKPAENSQRTDYMPETKNITRTRLSNCLKRTKGPNCSFDLREKHFYTFTSANSAGDISYTQKKHRYEYLAIIHQQTSKVHLQKGAWGGVVILDKRPIRDQAHDQWGKN